MSSKLVKSNAKGNTASKDWSEACFQSGHQFVRKGTPEYDEVKALYDSWKPEPTESMKKWNDCCKKLGYDYVKKNTLEYQKVLKEFKKQ